MKATLRRVNARAESRDDPAPGRLRRARAATWMLLVVLTVIAHGQALGQPGRLERHSAIYDPVRQRTLLFGGLSAGRPRNQVWALSLADTVRWELLAPLGAPPSGRFGHSAIYDPVADRMIVFGGAGDGGALNETWELSLGDSPAWTLLSPSGTPPQPRPYHTAIYDPLRRRMLVFGGESPTAYFNDVWSLWLGDTLRWEQLSPRRTPPATREAHSAIYDPLRDRMLVIGGFPRSDSGGWVWQLSLQDTAWRRIAVFGNRPGMLVGHSAVHDPLGDRMIVFGGHDGVGPQNQVWQLSLADSAWSLLTPAGGPPSQRRDHSAVYDSRHQAMVVFGGSHSGSDETWALSLGPTPAWSPSRPVVALSTAGVQLPTVTVGDTVFAGFSVANTGLEPLHVTAIRLPADSEMRLSSPPPLRLSWGQQVAQTLVLAARVPRTLQDSLVIESDDPIDPRKRVTLGIDVRGLDLDSRVLGSPERVLLGVSFPVIVTPGSGVRIESGRLFHRVAGVSDFDSVSLTPLSTDFIASVPARSVTERGVEYYVRVENSGFQATQPPGAPTEFFTQEVEPASSLVAVPRPTSGLDFLEGRPIEVEILLEDGAEFVSGEVHYREGGAQSYETDTIATRGVLGRPVATLPARIVGKRGVEYRLAVRTHGSDLRFPPGAPEPAIVRSRVQSLTEPSGHPGGRYRMLTVPLDFGPDFSGSLDAILTDQLGTYDPVRWRAFRYDPDSAKNLEFSPARAAAFRPRPGRAFWLASREAHRVDTDPIEGLSPPTGGPYPIVLSRGWNQFGNPFSFPVAWSDVGRDTVIEDPVAFDPSRGARGDYDYARAVTALAPFEGYFVWNDGQGPETLWVAPREVIEPPSPGGAPSPVGPPGFIPSRGTESWSIGIAAHTDRASDESNEFGVDPQAADGFDRLDLRKPPIPPGPWVRLAFENRDWERRPGSYRRDLRRAGVEGHTWEVELLSETVGEPVAIELPASAALPPDLAVRVLDREQGSFADMDRLTAAHRLKSGGVAVSDSDPAAETSAGAPAVPVLRHRVLSFGPDRPYRLAILAGSDEYVRRASDRERVVPPRLTLDPGVPNPFRIASRIRFGLPRAARVTAEIFGVLGARVAKLMDDAQLEPGYHALIWDGRTSAGRPAPSGVYLLRVVAGGDVVSRRLVLVR